MMPRFGPIKRRDMIGHLKRLGFSGPFSGGKHQFMIKNDLVLHIPNPHEGDIGRDLLPRILRQANITKQEWERLS
jgi:predicted RNA binding protein YcfA (HicA-like mRNA interferase family)